MLTAIVLAPAETVTVSTGKDGATVVTLPQAVLIRAYCDYVAQQVGQSAAKSEGAQVQ